MRTTARIAAATLILLPLAVGCIRYGGPSSLRRDLSREAGVELDAQFAITVTRSGVALARMFTKEEDVPLKGVRRVEVGVYEVEGLRRGVDERRPLELPALPGLEPVVRVHEDGEDVFVLFHVDEKEEIRQMVVIVAEEDEWVLVRIKGKLTRTVESAMKMAFDHADRPEKYDAAIEAYNEAQTQS